VYVRESTRKLRLLRRTNAVAALNIVLKLTKFCNMRCSYCFEYDHLGDPARMDPTALGHGLAVLADYARTAPGIDRVTLVLHGGEPLLLPTGYLLGVVAQARSAFAAVGMTVGFTGQTNLLRYDRDKLIALRDAGVGLGVSFDVLGRARITAGGAQTMERVAANMDRLRTDGIRFGAIAVLSRETISQIEQIHDWFATKAIDFRALPLLSYGEPQGAVHGLGIGSAERLAALRRLADVTFASDASIRVEPIDLYRKAALRYLIGASARLYEPDRQGEWALIVDTGGDLYSYGDCYLPEGLIGNIFDPSANASLLSGPRYAAMAAHRRARLAPCSSCPYPGYCDQVSQAEAAPTERLSDANGRALCAVDRAMIDHCLAHLRASPLAMQLVALARMAAGRQRATESEALTDLRDPALL
jgi:uncharacterized protein